MLEHRIGRICIPTVQALLGAAALAAVVFAFVRNRKGELVVLKSVVERALAPAETQGEPNEAFFGQE